MLRRIALAIAVLYLQSAGPQTPLPTFRTGVDVVQLDVTVLDKDRHPVRGLTADDFTILERGKPQSIVAFSAVDVPAPAPSAETGRTLTFNSSPEARTIFSRKWRSASAVVCRSSLPSRMNSWGMWLLSERLACASGRLFLMIFSRAPASQAPPAKDAAGSNTPAARCPQGCW